jgi:hypothetical protein
MIMTLQAGDQLLSVTDLPETLDIPVHTLSRWRAKGNGPIGYRVGRHVRYRREADDIGAIWFGPRLVRKKSAVR